MESGIQLFERFFLNAGNIGTGYSQLSRDLLLSQGFLLIKAVAQNNDDALPFREPLLYGSKHFLRLQREIELIGKVGRIAVNNIQHDDLIAVPICADRLMQGNVILEFLREP